MPQSQAMIRLHVMALLIGTINLDCLSHLVFLMPITGTTRRLGMENPTGTTHMHLPPLVMSNMKENVYPGKVMEKEACEQQDQDLPGNKIDINLGLNKVHMLISVIISISYHSPSTYILLEREREKRESESREELLRERKKRERSEMCSKSSPVGEDKQGTRISTRIKKRRRRESITMDNKSSPSNLEASRKIRTKTKKRPKYLSLKLELNTFHESKANLGTKKRNQKQGEKKGPDTTPFNCTDKGKMKVETVEDEQYDTVAAAYLFNSATDSTISSIHDLLPSSTAADCSDGGMHLPSFDRLQEYGSSSSSLLRTAMRKGASEGEETTEERWVSYSEVMSRSGTPRCWRLEGNDGRPSLSLKLDYEQIMEAWSDKGTLYVDGEQPQTVPDLHASAKGKTEGGEAGSLWVVPEMETTEKLWRDHREASLLRYKEKRQNRLFSKRIRYQVRKLNAEKRPRIKGRFVKRDNA